MATDYPIAPPYCSVGSFSEFIGNPNIRNLKNLTPTVLIQHGVSKGNASPVLSALRFLGMVNIEGGVIDQDIYRLGSQGTERPQIYGRILVRAYRVLLNEIELRSVTLDQVERHFLVHEVSKAVTEKASRFFLWFAEQAGYQLGESFRPYKMTTDETIPTTSVRDEVTSVIHEALDSGVDPYEERYLEIVLRKMEEQEDLNPEIMQLLDNVLRRRDSRLRTLAKRRSSEG